MLVNLLLATFASGKSQIQQLTVSEKDNTLMVNVNADIRFSKAVRNALSSGLELTFQYEFKIVNKGFFQRNTIARVNKSYQVAYQRLTNQYIVSDSVTLDSKNFDYLTQVSNHLSRLRDFPIILISQLPKKPPVLSVRFRLTNHNLPAFVSVERYFKPKDWQVNSDWHRFQLP